MNQGQDHVAGSNSIQARGQGHEKTEEKTQEQNPSIEGPQIKTGQPGEKEDEQGDARLGKETPFEAHKNDKKKEEKDLHPGIQLLEESLPASRIPLEAGRSNEGREGCKAFVHECRTG